MDTAMGALDLIAEAPSPSYRWLAVAGWCRAGGGDFSYLFLLLGAPPAAFGPTNTGAVASDISLSRGASPRLHDMLSRRS